MSEHTERITDATKQAERKDAQAEAGAPQVPSAAEEAAADRNGPVDDDTREHYRDMTEKGANQEGEGRIP